ncbi:MAG: LacI family DNA-binding transcriptional regulator, partial [Pauljensenia sp.]
MVNLGDIAKATGYSKATVSRILSGDPSFTAKDSTRQRVIRAANQLGYALRSSRSAVPQTIAVLDNIDPSRGLQDSYFSEVREALHARAADNMMSLSFFPDVNSLVEAASNFSGFVSVGPAPLKQ